MAAKVTARVPLRRNTIAVLRDGSISERGTHDELMTSGGLYPRWFATQATGYQDIRLARGIS